ncbi:MAG: hypothetical protein JW754_03850 [Candidatus Aenigmarchaeota archaeon]|nr:hypothetical protein [Candidatus Aenigmarchaeota archaeon]
MSGSKIDITEEVKANATHVRYVDDNQIKTGYVIGTGSNMSMVHGSDNTSVPFYTENGHRTRRRKSELEIVAVSERKPVIQL